MDTTMARSRHTTDTIDMEEASSQRLVENPKDLTIRFSDLRIQLMKSVKKSLVKGDTWYLVESRWFKQLQKYLNLTKRGNVLIPINGEVQNETVIPVPEDHPGPIDNTILLKENKIITFNEDGKSETQQKIRPNLLEHLDYEILPEESWTLLFNSFGLLPGQNPIDRNVIEEGRYTVMRKVEVYPMLLILVDNKDLNKSEERCFSKEDTLEIVANAMRVIFDVPDTTEVRLWCKRNQMPNFELLINTSYALKDTGVNTGTTLLIESKNIDGKWTRDVLPSISAPRTAFNDNFTPIRAVEPANSSDSTMENVQKEPSSSTGTTINNNRALVPFKKPNSSLVSSSTFTPSSTSSTYNGYSYDGYSANAEPGICGLINLGNTCFMNSILQSLSNIPPLAEYFACGNYEEDINEDNPLGMKGEVAKAFGELLILIWTGNHKHYAPRTFKMVIGQFAPSFSGYAQHDSQEFLTFLLDGLHEDLNRIKKKPYIEIPDSNGRPEDEVAKEAWSIYKKRNDSVILDLFHGLLKSTVKCPECPKVSVKFDPFCYLSLPLPVKRERRVEVTLVLMDPLERPTKYKVTCSKMGSILDLCQALSTLTEGRVPADHMIVVDVFTNRFHKVFQMDEGVHYIRSNDMIVAYEVPTIQDNHPEHLLLPVYLREKKNPFDPYCPYTLFGHPQIVTVPRQNLTYQRLYDCLVERFQRYIKIEALEDWKNNNSLKSSKSSYEGDDNNNCINNVTTNGNVMPVGTTEPLPSIPLLQESEITTSNASDSLENKIKGSTDTRNMKDSEQNDGNTVDDTSKNADKDSTNDVSSTTNGHHETIEEKQKNLRRSPKLFRLGLTNSYGSQEIGKLRTDNEILTLSSANYISLSWNKDKSATYNDEAEKDILEDESCKEVILTEEEKKKIGLANCLELYTRQEQLELTDAWYCPSCQKPQEAMKKFDIWSLPNILVINLKRFSFGRYVRDKLDTYVDFPTQGLDMQPYIKNSVQSDAIYDLCAVSNHYGGMGGGHYTAFAINKDDGKWYQFDDSSVTLSSEDAVVTKAAYVLFYQKRSMNDGLETSGISSLNVNSAKRIEKDSKSENRNSKEISPIEIKESSPNEHQVSDSEPSQEMELDIDNI